MQILKEAIKEKIIRAAMQEFYEKGFLLASTREIVKRAQISKGNLYNYFPSKEELFYAVTTPFYHHFNQFLQHLCGHEGKENFTLDRVELIAKSIADLIKDHRQEFILIMDKSEGTKYAGFKTETVVALERHFIVNLKPEFKQIATARILIMPVIASNFIEALLAFARDFEKEEELAANIGLYLKYHIKGMDQFY